MRSVARGPPPKRAYRLRPGRATPRARPQPSCVSTLAAASGVVRRPPLRAGGSAAVGAACAVVLVLVACVPPDPDPERWLRGARHAGNAPRPNCSTGSHPGGGPCCTAWAFQSRVNIDHLVIGPTGPVGRRFRDGTEPGSGLAGRPSGWAGRQAWTPDRPNGRPRVVTDLLGVPGPPAHRASTARRPAAPRGWPVRSASGWCRRACPCCGVCRSRQRRLEPGPEVRRSRLIGLRAVIPGQPQCSPRKKRASRGPLMADLPGHRVRGRPAPTPAATVVPLRDGEGRHSRSCCCGAEQLQGRLRGHVGVPQAARLDPDDLVDLGEAGSEDAVEVELGPAGRSSRSQKEEADASSSTRRALVPPVVLVAAGNAPGASPPGSFWRRAHRSPPGGRGRPMTRSMSTAGTPSDAMEPCSGRRRSSWPRPPSPPCGGWLARERRGLGARRCRRPGDPGTV